MAYSTIPKGSLQTNSVLYTGTAAIQSIPGVGFEPDMIWCKERGASNGGPITDKVRGISTTSSPFLISQSGDAQQGDNGTVANRTITATSADGFTLGADSYYTNFNKNNGSFVSWNWKVGGAGSANTDGSTAVAKLSVNQTAGISIGNIPGGFVSTGSNSETIGHGLGKPPEFIMFKSISTNDNWICGHGSYGWTKNGKLNTNDSFGTSTLFNNTTPNNQTFSVRGGDYGTGFNMIFYCFTSIQGYSKFGRYTGNGSSNGTLTYTGFKPSFIMIKVANDDANWLMFDNKREGYNVDNDELYANVSDAEQTYDHIDFLSNGFKIRANGTSINLTSNIYTYWAFAENPFVATSGTTAVPVTAR